MAASIPNNRPQGSDLGFAEASTSDATPWTVTRCSEALSELAQLLDQMREWHTRCLKQQDLTGPDSDADDGITIPEEQTSRNQSQGSQPGASKESDLAQGENYSTDPAWASNERRWQKRNKNGYGAHRKMLPKTPNRERSADLKTPDAQQEFISGANKVNTPFIAAYICGENNPPRPRGAARMKKDTRTRLQYIEMMPDGSINKNLDAPISDQRHVTEMVWNRCGGGYLSVLDRFTNVVRDFLLSTDDEPAKKPQFGARRLGFVCERKLGRILADEVVEDTEENKPGDMVKSPFTAPVLLNDLQDYFGGERIGWKPLRHITQAMGISLICKAIEDEVIANEAIFELLDRIEFRKLLDDKDVVDLETALQFRWSMSKSDTFQRTILTQFVPLSEDPACFAPSWPSRPLCTMDFACRMMAATIRRHGYSLPAHYLSFRRPLISNAISEIFKETVETSGATEFLQGAMVWLLDYPCTGDQRCDCFGLACQAQCPKSTFRTVCSCLTFEHIAVKQSTRPLVLQVMHFVKTHIERELHNLAAASNATKQRYLYFMTALSLMKSASYVELCAGLPLIMGYILRQNNCASLKSVKTEFAMDVVNWWNSQQVTDQGDIRMVTERLIEQGFGSWGRVQEFFFDMALEIAMRFAARQRTDEDLKWALFIQDRLSTHRIESGAQTLQGIYFRWEESINEWVEKTPAPRRSQPNRQHDVSLPANSLQSLVTNRTPDFARQEQVPIQNALDRQFHLKPKGSNVHDTKRYACDIDIADESGDELATGSPQLKQRISSSMYAGNLEHTTPRMKPKGSNCLEQCSSNLAGTGYSSEDELGL